jgi:predicted alpha/beta superfamily hydrolase
MVTNDESPLTNTEVHYLRSKAVGDEFKIHTWLLPGPVDQAPVVLYLTDANILFGGTVDTVQLLRVTDYVPPTLVVGVGYRSNSLVDTLQPRTRDLTPTVDPSYTDVPPGTGGGAERLLEFIREDLMPWVQSRYETDPSDSAYFGDSLGGLFGMYVLLHAPDTFHKYGLGSPSFWWNERVIFEEEEAYAAEHDDLSAKVFMSVGEYENEEGQKRHLAWLPQEKREAQEKEPVSDMVGDMQRMVDRLRTRSYPSLDVGSEVLPGEFHNTSPLLNLSRSLRYLFDAPR